jgi:hypothetical protein
MHWTWRTLFETILGNAVCNKKILLYCGVCLPFGPFYILNFPHLLHNSAVGLVKSVHIHELFNVLKYCDCSCSATNNLWVLDHLHRFIGPHLTLVTTLSTHRYKFAIAHSLSNTMDTHEERTKNSLTANSKLNFPGWRLTRKWLRWLTANFELFTGWTELNC